MTQNSNPVFNIMNNARRINAAKANANAAVRNTLNQENAATNTAADKLVNEKGYQQKGQADAMLQARDKLAPTNLTNAQALGDEVDRIDALERLKEWFRTVLGHPVDVYNQKEAKAAINEIREKYGIDNGGAVKSLQNNPQLNEQVEKAEKLLFGLEPNVFNGGRWIWSGKYDISNDPVTGAAIGERGAVGIYSDSGKYADKWRNTKIGDTGLTNQQLVDAIAMNVRTDYLSARNDTALKQMLHTAYINYNQTGEQKYYNAADKIGKQLLKTAFGGGASYQQCIDYLKTILALARSADSQGGKFVNTARYREIANNIRQLEDAQKQLSPEQLEKDKQTVNLVNKEYASNMLQNNVEDAPKTKEEEKRAKEAAKQMKQMLKDKRKPQ